MKSLIAATIITTMSVTMIVIAIKSYISVPIAVFSHSTDQCVKILYYDGVKSPCGELPDRYHMEWTQ